MNVRPLRFGILGCARIARRGMIAGIQQSNGAVLAGIASRNGQLAQEWAREFSIPKSFDSYQALIDDPEIDAIYNPLPNELHRRWSLRAAEAGKHVLCEKPLGLDLADAEALVAGCRKHGVLLAEAFMWRHHPRIRRALELVRLGAIGDLRLVKMDFSFNIDPGDWRLDFARGGGALYDLGCYGLNAVRFFTGQEPDDIAGFCRRGPSGVDMTSSLVVHMPGNVLGLFDASFECAYRNRLELVGTRGTLEIPGGVLPEPESELILNTPDEREIIRFPVAQQYVEQVKAFCASVQATKLVEGLEDGLANMRALDRARLALVAQ
jgi:predicted dehydrogenase